MAFLLVFALLTGIVSSAAKDSMEARMSTPKPTAASALRSFLLSVLIIASTGLPLNAEGSGAQEKAFNQFGLSIPRDLVCDAQSLDERAPIRLPIRCWASDNSGLVYIDVLGQPAFDLPMIGESLPRGTAWVRTSATSTLPPIRWGFDPGWLYHPDLSARELLCARTAKPLDLTQVSAQCFSLNLPGESVITIRFHGFGLVGGIGPFPVEARDDAILEMLIEAIALRVDILE